MKTMARVLGIGVVAAGIGTAVVAPPVAHAAPAGGCTITKTWDTAIYDCDNTPGAKYANLRCLGWWLPDGFPTRVGVYVYPQQVSPGRNVVSCNYVGLARKGVLLDAWTTDHWPL